jgi:hypothetical protein
MLGWCFHEHLQGIRTRRQASVHTAAIVFTGKGSGGFSSGNLFLESPPARDCSHPSGDQRCAVGTEVDCPGHSAALRAKRGYLLSCAQVPHHDRPIACACRNPPLVGRNPKFRPLRPFPIRANPRPSVVKSPDRQRQRLGRFFVSLATILDKQYRYIPT